MLDRESTFADPQIVTLLQTKFIPVAIDQAYQRRQQDAEGDFYRKIAGQGPRNNFKGTTQGLYIATAAGQFLGYNNNRGPDRVRRLMKTALDQFKPADVAPIDSGRKDPQYNPTPPEGGLILRVRAKVLDGYEETGDRWRRIFQQSVSRDNLWVSRGEHEQLVRGVLPEALQRRIARYHLVDNTRGEPPMWREDEIREIQMTLENGRLRGTVHLETVSGDRGYEAQLLGTVKIDAGKVTQLDVIAKGQFWGEGTYTRGAPAGKFPLAVSFTLADGTDVADGIPPQASRGWIRGYLTE